MFFVPSDSHFRLALLVLKLFILKLIYNKKSRVYEIRGVIGPDEFHADVNNNTFTNMMAKWNLLTANRLFKRLKKTNRVVFKNLSQKLGLNDKEGRGWKKVAAHIKINMNKAMMIFIDI